MATPTSTGDTGATAAGTTNGLGRRHTTERRSTETKASFKTTEFFSYLAVLAGILVAGLSSTTPRPAASAPRRRGSTRHPDRRLHGQPRAGQVRQPRALHQRQRRSLLSDAAYHTTRARLAPGLPFEPSPDVRLLLQSVGLRAFAAALSRDHAAPPRGLRRRTTLIAAAPRPAVATGCSRLAGRRAVRGSRHQRTGLRGCRAPAVRPLRARLREPVAGAAGSGRVDRRARVRHRAIPSCSSTEAGCRAPPGRRCSRTCPITGRSPSTSPGSGSVIPTRTRADRFVRTRWRSSRRCSTRWALRARRSSGPRWARCGRSASRSKQPERVSAVVAIGMPAVGAAGPARGSVLPAADDPGPWPDRLARPSCAQVRQDNPKGHEARHRASRAGPDARRVLRGGLGRDAHAGLARGHVDASQPRAAIRTRTTGERAHRRGAPFDRDAGPLHLGPGRCLRRARDRAPSRSADPACPSGGRCPATTRPFLDDPKRCAALIREALPR